MSTVDITKEGMRKAYISSSGTNKKYEYNKITYLLNYITTQKMVK